MPFLAPSLKHHLDVRTAPMDWVTPPTPGVHLSFHFGRERGIVLEHVDGTQLLLLSLLDGRHSFDHIVARLQAEDPAVTASDVTDVLDDLARFGLIEDAAVSIPEELTESDVARYESQVRFFSVLDMSGQQRYEMQARLKRARIAVIGLGGLGSNVLIGLAAAGVGCIRGVDFDVVEVGNLNRQVLYDSADVGQPKAQAAAEQLRRFNPTVRFEPRDCRIEDVDQLQDLIGDVDLVAMCADLPRGIMGWMNRASLATGVPFIIGGYRGVVAEVGPLIVPFETCCLSCGYPDPLEGPPEALAWITEAFWLRHPNAHFVTAAAANLTCSEIIKHITKLAAPVTYNHRYSLDLEKFTLIATPCPRDENCHICGGLRHAPHVTSVTTPHGSSRGLLE
ncbi:MAG: ThiF family adenylyltransferase [Ktedonobacterales bacterium]